ncbi:HNH endonuclease [Cedecea sp. NFIX57]|uniref:HNH endonuclease n=1 Tax=Cedecea sp. NFIX57 TaxID=1566286 RepID=UPI000A0DF519|nr:HNH endonuclease signature motif containing protein [Cedecea sp. NFIX57]SMG29027.1 HNH endonuclease [Cedecea sp. NFIX57]
MQYFYAYHGPQNEKDFDPKGGYGTRLQHNYERVKDGDRVFIIQKLAGRNSLFYLCGEYEITGHSINNKLNYKYRFALKDVSQLDHFIELDPIALSKMLPKRDGDSRWNIFQRHFCRQGAAFARALDSNVVEVLSSLVGEAVEAQFEHRPRREDGLRMVKVRQDQAAFRRDVLNNWNNKCAITGSSLAVEACHIISHASQGEPTVENGIALAADLHHLFDSDDLSFEGNRVILSLKAQNEPRYHALHNAEIQTPKTPVKFRVN